MVLDRRVWTDGSFLGATPLRSKSELRRVPSRLSAFARALALLVPARGRACSSWSSGWRAGRRRRGIHTHIYIYIYIYI